MKTKTEKSDDNKNRRSKSGRILTIVLIGLLLAALAGAGFWYVTGGDLFKDVVPAKKATLSCVQELGSAKSVLTFSAPSPDAPIETVRVAIENDAKSVLESNGIDTTDYDRLNMKTILDHLTPRLQNQYAALYSIPADQIQVSLKNDRITVTCKIQDVPAFFAAMQMPADASSLTIASLKENESLSGCR